MDVKDFVKEFRDRIGDTSCSVPVSYIIAYLNTALRRLARSDGLEKLFEHRDTFELASINNDGMASAAWDLGKIGQIININKLRILKANDAKITELTPTFKEYDDFFDCNPLPEQRSCGDPTFYTIEQVGSVNRLLFDRPPKNLIAIDMKFSSAHPRITSQEDKIEINYFYCDALLDMVEILHKSETTDMATARALYEDLDLVVTEIKEQLARRHTALGYRRVKRSF